MTMDKATILTEMHKAWSACQGCRLCNERNSVVFGYGNPDSKVVVVGEAPGSNEDMLGVPFVGPAGNLLDQYFAGVSVNPDLVEMAEKGKFDPEETRSILLDRIFYTNVVCCRPPENRDPAVKEIAACKIRLFETIYIIDPILVVGAGRIPVEVLLNRKVSITQAQGDWFDIKIPGKLIDVHYPMLAILHPAYLLRVNDFNQKGGMSDKTYFHILKAMHVLDHFKLLHYGTELPSIRQKLPGD